MRILIMEITERNSFMIRVSKDVWDGIYDDYKGEWHDYYDEHPEWLGRKVVMSACISDVPGRLFVEGVDFEIHDGCSEIDCVVCGFSGERGV